jgi:prolipoprotein diacylglyceryltransferase
MEFSLLWAALTAFGAGLLAIRILKPNEPDRPLDRLIGAAVVGLFGGRIVTLLMTGINPLFNPGQVILIRGVVDTIPAAFVGAIALIYPLRKAPRSLDAMAPIALIVLAGWQTGCVWRETCLGTVSDLPWAWSLSGSTLDRHPVEIYTALLLLIGAWSLSFVKWPVGTAAALAVATAGGSRLVTEPFRLSIGKGPGPFYALALVVGLVIAARLTLRAQPPSADTLPS